MRVSVRIAGADRGRNPVVVLALPGLGHDVLRSSDCAPAVTVCFLEKPAGGCDTCCLARVQMPAFTTV
ncbi:hypothetical protein GXW84_00805 [Rhodococcus sp. IEGM 248]|uniref:hypothetical protein n=1 Tax=Rhodococcus opacus TaxID=37919 RepID=UPI0013C04C45|nr:hypothetical protein [Rhodococcus opacus]NDV03075.1 hypothetical protein [Rhodococcus sp. IEGM 248]